jgi:hypothetical protein
MTEIKACTLMHVKNYFTLFIVLVIFSISIIIYFQ